MAVLGVLLEKFPPRFRGEKGNFPWISSYTFSKANDKHSYFFRNREKSAISAITKHNASSMVYMLEDAGRHNVIKDGI